MKLLQRLVSGCGCCLMPILLLVAAGTGYFYFGPTATHWVSRESPAIIHDAHLVATAVHRLWAHAS